MTIYLPRRHIRLKMISGSTCLQPVAVREAIPPLWRRSGTHGATPPDRHYPWRADTTPQGAF